MLKVRTLFSGIGAPESALDKLDIDYELVDFCEVDKYAVKSYCAVHGVSEDKNLGDITKVWGRNLPYADLLVWGFPCQDISVAGKQRGLKEGETRSGLYYEGFRILKETKPMYSIIENVKNLVGKKFKDDFNSMLQDIESIGYNNYWKVLNAKDYGIPQNRERVFIVSIRKDVDDGNFEFPIGFDNGLRLKDFLEDEVDEKYYISQEKTEKLIRQLNDKNSLMLDMCQSKREGKPREYTDYSPTLSARDYKEPRLINVGNVNPSGNGMNGNVFSGDGLSPTITTNKGEGPKIAIPCLTPDRLEKRQNGRRFKEDGEPMFTLTSQDRHGILQVGNIVDTGNFNNPQRGRIYSQEGISPALNTCGGGGLEPKILEDFYSNRNVRIYDECPTLRSERNGLKTLTSAYRIRKLTPKECWRLMGFTDEEFEKATRVNSNSQLYKQAGNSIVVNVLEYIFQKLLKVEIKKADEEAI